MLAARYHARMFIESFVYMYIYVLGNYFVNIRFKC